MKYKAMVLLEDLIEHFSPESNYRIYFTIDFKDKYTGTFRKTKERLGRGEYVDIDSEKLLRDFQSYMNDNEGSRQGITELFAHLQSDVAYKKEKLANYLLAVMADFLEDEETNPDAYLMGYDGPEVIYDLTAQDENQGDFILAGREVELLSLFDYELDEII